MKNEHPQVYDLLYEYYLIIEPMLTRQLLISKQTYDKRTLTEYIAKLMRLKYDADIAFHNTGGTRKAIAANEIITEGLLYQVLPFDNQMITMKMLGKDIKQMHTIY